VDYLGFTATHRLVATKERMSALCERCANIGCEQSQQNPAYSITSWAIAQRPQRDAENFGGAAIEGP
jgi:hypothetical protein